MHVHEIRYNRCEIFFLFLCWDLTVTFHEQPLEIESTELVQKIVTDTITTVAENYYLFQTEWYKICTNHDLRVRMSIKAPAHQDSITTNLPWPCHALLPISPTFPRRNRRPHPRLKFMAVPRLLLLLPLFHIMTS